MSLRSAILSITFIIVAAQKETPTPWFNTEVFTGTTWQDTQTPTPGPLQTTTPIAEPWTTTLQPESTPISSSNGTERNCACTYNKIWLDISFLIESSSAMTQNGLLEISGTLADVVGELTISQTIQQASRAGVAVYADTTAQLSQLNTFDSIDPIKSQLLRLYQTNFVNTGTPNLLAGMSSAIGIFNGPGNRAYARNVLVLVASSYAQGTANDAVQLANQFKESGGFIIVIAYQQPNQAAIPRICDLASPGMCFSNRNDTGMLFNNIATSLCIANCFCKRNDFQFMVNFGANPLYYGSCIHAINAPATANIAQMICNNEDGALSTIFNSDKLTFLTNISVNVLETDQSWVGLRYYSTQSPAGWYWLDAAGQYTPWNNMPDWNPGMPNRALGDCVQLKRYQGFALRLTSAQCSQASTAFFPYTCQYNACDTDKFCPEANF